MSKNRNVQQRSLGAKAIWQTLLREAKERFKIAPSSSANRIAINYTVSIPIHRVLQALGRTISLREKGVKYQISIPTAGELYTAAWPALQSLVITQAQWVTGLVPQSFIGSESSSEQEMNALLITLLERLPQALVRENEQTLTEILTLLTAGLTVTRAEVLRRNRLPLPIESGIKTLRSDIIVLTAGLERYFGYLRALRWDRVFNLEVIFGEFLPPGDWPTLPVKTPQSAIQLSETPVSGSDKRIDPGRLSIYQKLGCRKVLEPVLGSDFYRREYLAYIFVAPSGARIAVLDTASVNNAAYIFRIGDRAEQSCRDWVDEAQKTKRELVYRTVPTNHFLGRVVHSKGWELRLQAVLELL